MRKSRLLLLIGLLPTMLSGSLHAAGPLPVGAATRQLPQESARVHPQQALLNRYCLGCHNERTMSGNFVLSKLDLARIDQDRPSWEKVARKLRAGVMPPIGAPRPDDASYEGLLSWVETELDRVAAAYPDPGRTETFHRLNRAEYRNAIRDLLSLEVQIDDLLPADDASSGFDNMAGALRISQALLERYVATAKTVSRLATGVGIPARVDSTMYRIPMALQQHQRLEDLPFGTRGGALIRHLFPLGGEYDLLLEVAGGVEPGETVLELSIDGAQLKTFEVGPARTRGRDGSKFEVRVPIKAGPHEISATFFPRAPKLVERQRAPFANPNHERLDGGPSPVVSSLTVTGPHNVVGPGDTPSRRKIFACHPSNTSQEPGCASTILSTLARRAYRGFQTDKDLQVLLRFYREGRAEGDSFEAGIERALSWLLASPQFLYRIETDPANGKPATLDSPSRSAARTTPKIYRLGNLDLASRLSFFLWSSIPDDELLDLATKGTLGNAATLERQVQRMLADPRSEALTQNFAGQWLTLRNMSSRAPGHPYSLAFDDSLRQSMTRETELFFDHIVRDDRPLTEMLTADYSFLNERLAQHYGIPNVQGTHFRRVSLPADGPRRGILGHGSILTLTSHAIRTSPVIRGAWVLRNIVGAPPPEPPPDVPALAEKTEQARALSVRDRMVQHRSNPACASCHALIDPAGFALEHFDAIGRWRDLDESFNPIDSSGALPDGTKFSGVADFRTALASHPDRFVTTVTEKLLTYALGRGLEFYDMSAVRKIVKESALNEYRFQSIIKGVVKSYPFRERRVELPAPTGRTAEASR